MPDVILRSVPREVLDGLRRRARQHGRSLNQEVIGILASAVARAPLDTEAFLATVSADQRRRAWAPLTDRELRVARRRGRP